MKATMPDETRKYGMLHLMTPEERFARIEKILERSAVGHQELEAAQLNQQKAHTRLEEVGTETNERITNLTILVDRLVAKDLDT